MADTVALNIILEGLLSMIYLIDDEKVASSKNPYPFKTKMAKIKNLFMT